MPHLRLIKRGIEEIAEVEYALGFSDAKYFHKFMVKLSKPKYFRKCLSSSKRQLFKKSDFRVIENFDPVLKNLLTDKVRRAKESLKKNTLHAPIILKRNNRYWLLAGNTSAAMQVSVKGNFRADVILNV